MAGWRQLAFEQKLTQLGEEISPQTGRWDSPFGAGPEEGAHKSAGGGDPPCPLSNNVGFLGDGLEQCEAGGFSRGRCSHGKLEVRSMACRQCEVCLRQWRRALTGKTSKAAERIAAAGYVLWFLTLTIQGQETVDELWERMVGVWSKTVRNSDLFRGKIWMRVFESGERGGRPHTHVILAMPEGEDLPFIPAIQEGQTVQEWQAGLSADARKLQRRLMKQGWGPVMHVEEANSPAGVATYLGGYLGSQAKTVYRDGKHRRLWGASKLWSDLGGRETESTLFGAGPQVMTEARKEQRCEHCANKRAVCKEARAEARTHEEREAARAMCEEARADNMERWLEGLDCEQFRERVGALAYARHRRRGGGIMYDLARRMSVCIRECGYAGPIAGLMWWYNRQLGLSSVSTSTCTH